MKKCTKCGAVKNGSEFTIRKASNDGLAPLCRMCKRASDKVYREAHPGLMAKAGREYRARNPGSSTKYKKQGSKGMNFTNEKEPPRVGTPGPDVQHVQQGRNQVRYQCNETNRQSTDR